MSKEKCYPTWLCCECGGERVEGVLSGLRDQRDSIGGVRLQACESGSTGSCRLDQSLVLTSTGARTGPGSPSSTATIWNFCWKRSKANLIVSPQARQNWAPVKRGGVRGDVTDVESLSSDDLCRRQDEGESTMGRLVIQHRNGESSGGETVAAARRGQSSQRAFRRPPS